MTSAWKSALHDNRWLLAATGTYCAAVLAEAAWCGLPLAELLLLGKYIAMSLLMATVFLAGMCAGAFFGLVATGPKGARFGAGMAGIGSIIESYVKGGRFAHACLGLSVVVAGNFFLVSKSLISAVNPFYVMKWDETFAAWDKALHFGMYPHAFIIPAVNALGLGVALDRLYVFWMMAMLLVFGYCLFADDSPQRRMRFLWSYFLSWALLGTVMATGLSSVGPMFFSDYFSGGHAYDTILQNLGDLHRASGMYAETVRNVLLRWTKNGVMFDPNAISAMPSMHIAICWLLVLYMRSFGAWVFMMALLFCAAVFTASVYLGFHYAIDGYVSIVAVSVVWWVLGKCLGRSRATETQSAEAGVL